MTLELLAVALIALLSGGLLGFAIAQIFWSRDNEKFLQRLALVEKFQAEDRAKRGRPRK
jgi:hypothetical protein